MGSRGTGTSAAAATSVAPLRRQRTGLSVLVGRLRARSTAPSPPTSTTDAGATYVSQPNGTPSDGGPTRVSGSHGVQTPEPDRLDAARPRANLLVDAARG